MAERIGDLKGQMVETGQKVKAGFIHTTPSSIGMVDRFARLHLPEVIPVHLYDGRVKIDNFKWPAGITPPKNMLRWANFGDQLERDGCCVIVSCCSLMPRATEYAAKVVTVPFIQLDAVILDRVVEKYDRIGVINTTPYTVPHVTEEIRRREKEFGRKVSCDFSNTNGALDLFNQGRFEEHDNLVIESILKMEKRGVDCILMGQIPFGLMDEKLQKLSLKMPLYYTGAEAFHHIKELIGT